MARKWILDVSSRRDETRCGDCDLCLFATDIIETDGVSGNIHILHV